MIFNFENTQVYFEFLNKKSTSTPILFLHGWGGDTRSFKYFAKKMSTSNPCILLDFPPFGKSEEPQKAWNVLHYAMLVENLLQSLGIQKVFVVSHSFGGRVAIEMCSRKVIKVKKLLLTGSAGLKRKSFATKLKIVRYKFVKIMCKLHILNKSNLQKFGSSDYKKLTPIMKQTFINVVRYDQRKLLKNISCPTLLFWGKNDKDTPFCFTKVFKKNINDCEVIDVSGGHFAYLEHHDLFLKIMLSFFKE